MLLKPEPLFEAIEDLRRKSTRVILLSPAGRKFDQAIARELAGQKHLLLVTGHYEGFDERVREKLADDELSIGDYVLTNGALPAMVVIDAVTRLLPGVLGDDESSQRRVVQFRPAGTGISAIHAAGGISRDESSRDVVVRQPRRN